MNHLVYPYEYFLAQVYFALKIASLTSKNLEEVFIYYTNLYSSVIGIDWREDPSSQHWTRLMHEVIDEKDAEKIANIFFSAYTASAHSIYNPAAVPQGMVAFGPLVVDYTSYNKERNTIRIHYLPVREEKSWLASERFPQLQEQFKKLLIYAQQHYAMQYLTSSTWLTNIPNYRKLFPQTALEREKNIGMGSFLGVWQEFLKSDGYGNTERLQEFLYNLAQSQTVDQSIDAIPLKVLESVSPIEEFYQMYAIPRYLVRDA